jgi:hypothetical protein
VQPLVPQASVTNRVSIRHEVCQNCAILTTRSILSSLQASNQQMVDQIGKSWIFGPTSRCSEIRGFSRESIWSSHGIPICRHRTRDRGTSWQSWRSMTTSPTLFVRCWHISKRSKSVTGSASGRLSIWAVSQLPASPKPWNATFRSCRCAATTSTIAPASNFWGLEPC